MFDCPHCSNQLPDGAAFCNQCWRPVDDPPRAAADPAPAAEAPTSAAWTVPPPAPASDDRPTFTPAPGGPPPPEGDDVTSAYPQMPPPQPQTPWATGEPTSAPPPAPGWATPPPAAPGWGQPQPPAGSADPYGAPAQPGYGPPPGYGYSAPPPGYGPQAPYGYPQPGYYGYAVPAGPGTNGMAIAALVSALAGLTLSCGLLAPLGIVFGHIALHQIKSTGENGRGMAIAGLVIGYLCLAAVAGFIILAVASSGSA